LALASAVGIGAATQADAAPKWTTHGYVTSRQGPSSLLAYNVINAHTTKEPKNLRVRNIGTAAVFLDFSTTCYQYQKGQPSPYAVVRSMFNVPMKAKTGSINVWPKRMPGTITPYAYCTVRTQAHAQRQKSSVLTVVVEGI
jgi:hypothetical protein